MSDSTQKKAQGTWDEVKGKTKAAAGDLTDDESMQAKGKAEEMKGKAEKKVGEAQGKFNDLTKDKSDNPS